MRSPLAKWLLSAGFKSVCSLVSFALLGASAHGQGMASPDGPKVSSAEGSELFDHVIANQKKLDADMNVYERVERVEIRKTGGDAKPSEVKVWRVFPAGTGNNKIPLNAEAKPADAAS